MKRNIVGFFLILGAVLISCSTRDYFGKLTQKEILAFQLEKQVGNSKITEDSIFITVSGEITDLSATLIKVSDFATVTPGVGDKMDFSNPVPYTVTAEDESVKVYHVNVTLKEGDDNGDDDEDPVEIVQIPNSNFNLWHETVHKFLFKEIEYMEIGENEEDDTWGTGNRGAATVKLMGAEVEFPSQPFERSTGNFAAELITQNMGTLAAGSLGGGKGIAAGNLFTGTFDASTLINAHPVFGYPYTETPSAFQVDYQYIPAEGLIDGKLKPVEGTDALDIFVILEKREGDNAKRLGVGWFRSGETQSKWVTKSVDIKYAHGSAPEGLEPYQTKVLKYGWGGDITITDPNDLPETAWGDITVEDPTHIVVVFTSSYQGDYFIGAPGSRLLVDNFKLIP